jgi:RNA polymerase sigma-70 factor (ECF subfamily)
MRGEHGASMELRDMLEWALLQLPAAHREAFILREYFGYSYEEVGEISGGGALNAKMRSWRARERLRKMIAAWMELRKE